MFKNNLWLILNFIVCTGLLILGILFWFRFGHMEQVLVDSQKPVTITQFAILVTPTLPPAATPPPAFNASVGDDEDGGEETTDDVSNYPVTHRKVKKAFMGYPYSTDPNGIPAGEAGPIGVGWKFVNHNPFSFSRNPAVVEFQNKLWVIGGLNNQDAWSSADGAQWTKEAEQLGPAASSASGAAVWKNKLWLAGAGNVISSADGVHWDNVTSQAAFGNKSLSRLVSFNDKLWLIAGTGDGGITNDIWNSVDGVNWNRVVDHADFPPRHNVNAFVFNGRLWVVGGFANGYDSLLDDVWCSENGISWKRIDMPPHFKGRTEFPVFPGDGKIWIVGGDEGNFVFKSDVWNSTDGIYWNCLRQSIPGFNGIGHSGIYYQGHIWVLGGDGGMVWCSPNP